MMRDLYSDQTNTTHTKKGFFSFFDLIFVILFINQSEFFFQKRNVVKRMLTRKCKGRHQGCKEANDTDVSRILNNRLWRTRRCTKYENHAKVLKNLLNISFYQLTSKYLLHSTFQLSKKYCKGSSIKHLHGEDFTVHFCQYNTEIFQRWKGLKEESLFKGSLENLVTWEHPTSKLTDCSEKLISQC